MCLFGYSSPVPRDEPIHPPRIQSLLMRTTNKQCHANSNKFCIATRKSILPPAQINCPGHSHFPIYKKVVFRKSILHPRRCSNTGSTTCRSRRADQAHRMGLAAAAVHRCSCLWRPIVAVPRRSRLRPPAASRKRVINLKFV
jgi:hypothetical protein